MEVVVDPVTEILISHFASIDPSLKHGEYLGDLESRAGWGTLHNDYLRKPNSEFRFIIVMICSSTRRASCSAMVLLSFFQSPEF